MSSPRSVKRPRGQACRGTRVVLREITAMLHNSSTQTSPRRKNDNDSSTFSKAAANEHEIKVRFAREFADADSVTYSAPESLSSASSFYSINSTLSTKSSSGISPDTVPNSPQTLEFTNSSYVDDNIPGVDDLINAYAHIRLNSATELSSFNYESPDNTHDHTFESANDETPPNIINEISVDESTLPEKEPIDSVSSFLDVTHVLPHCHSQSHQEDCLEHLTSTNIHQEVSCVEENLIGDKHTQEESSGDLRESEVECVKLVLEESSTKSTSLTNFYEPEVAKVEDLISNSANESKTAIDNAVDGKSNEVNVDEKSINVHTFANELFIKASDVNEDCNDTHEKKVDISNVDEKTKDIVNVEKEEIEQNNIIVEETDAGDTDGKETGTDSIEKEKFVTCQELSTLNISANEKNNCNKEKVIRISVIASDEESVPLERKNNLPEPVFIETERLLERSNITEDHKDQVPTEELDRTLTLPNDISINLDSLDDLKKYEDFKPQRQSTSLTNAGTICGFKDLELAAGEIANDILISSLELEDQNYTTPVLEIFQDPTTFDFLSARGNSQTATNLRNESLYIKFDPLLAKTIMLSPQNDKVFSSPPSGTIHKLDEIQEKNDEPIQVSNKCDTKEVDQAEATEKIELVRATVLQLEKELKKQKKEYEAELEKQKTAFQDKITKLQAQLSQEIENKKQLTVVVDEYEKSISRLLTERERDRANFEQEKMKLQEELQATNHHLSNTEAAFNDVHLKYERLKSVISAYKNNESVLKESIQENLETIKSLDNRYDQLKTHAMSQLRKANLELVDIRKQHEAETVKLHAMVRKAELKSNSLSEIVEQKTKENKELTQILDELIARVGRQNAD